MEWVYENNTLVSIYRIILSRFLRNLQKSRQNLVGFLFAAIIILPLRGCIGENYAFQAFDKREAGWMKNIYRFELVEPKFFRYYAYIT